jgi:hypothetical protein
MHNIDPFKWLSTVLDKIADHKITKLHELFPQNIDLRNE